MSRNNHSAGPFSGRSKSVREDIRERTASRQQLLLDENTPFVVTEAYKALRTNIIFSLPGSDCKCIAVTSTGRAEGKSTNTINLTISLAQTGSRVVLIDADMRLPVVAATLHKRAQPGLSNILIGDSEFKECFLRVEEYGFDLIPSGTIPPDPTRLLGSSQMQSLIDALRRNYNYIVIDLPPVNTVTDAVILSSLVDGYLMLVRRNATEHRGVVEMIGNLQKADAKLLGFLYTGAPVSDKKYGKYGYGYGGSSGK